MKKMGMILAVWVALCAGLGWLAERDQGPIVLNHEGESKLILRSVNLPFGKTPRILDKPGWSLRLPGLTQVLTLDARVRHVPVSSISVTVKPPESDVFEVDCALLWRIEDPARFYDTFGAAGEDPDALLAAAEGRLSTDIHDIVSSEISRHTFADLLGDDRESIAQAIVARGQEMEARTGVRLVAVLFSRIQESSAAREVVYQRMRSYQAQVAADFRAQATSESEQIHAKADAGLRRTVAETEKQTSLSKAAADAEAARIYAEAYEQDREFFRFLRSLEAYRKALDANTTIMISPDNTFFDYFNSDAKRSK